jgi:hypothetical protein
LADVSDTVWVAERVFWFVDDHIVHVIVEDLQVESYCFFEYSSVDKSFEGVDVDDISGFDCSRLLDG